MRNADNLPPSCAVVTKSGNLNFLEPSGPVQACNGTALPCLCFPNFPTTDGNSMVRKTDSVVKRTLRVFENRVLGKIIGPKRDEVTEG